MKTPTVRILSLGLILAVLIMLVLGPITPQAAALSYSGSNSYQSGKYYTALTAVTLTGDQRTDIVNVAKSQVGYLEGSSSSQLSGTSNGSGNYTEYGRWYGMQDMWCAMFVSWCANVAGIPTSIVTSHSYTPTGLNWFINKGQAYSRATVANGGYTPQPGDIIYFKSDRNENITNHVGIVTKYSGSTVYTIEGNTSSATISTNGGAVCEKSYSISNTYIVYICSPSYTSSISKSTLKSVVFDATYYANKYTDAKSACGTDVAKLYDHFLDTGISGGRQASPVFDVKYYLDNNSAVKSACGSDYQKAYDHFLEKGYKSAVKTAAPANLGDSFQSKIGFESGKNLSLSDTNVIIYPDSDKPAQVWNFVRLSNGAYKIINTKNDLCLSVTGNSAATGTNVEILTYDGSTGQQWFIYKNGGKYVLKPYCSGYCVLDVTGASTDDLTNVQIAVSDNAKGQLFTLTVNDGTNSVGATPAQMTVIRKIIYAVETGGQVYGNVDYDDFTEAYTNSSEEHAITIGGGQWYATEAKKLLNLIRSTDPTTFAQLDTAGIASDLDSADWSTYKLSASSAKAKCIVKIISSDVGIRCQDQLIDEQMLAYMIEAKNLGVTNLDAMMMCANIRHQGGLSALKRVLGKTATPYTLDNIYAALKTDTGNQVGAYTSRQKFVYNTLKSYISGSASSTVKYLPACSANEESLVTGLNSVGAPSDAEYRMRLAIANGITDYAYTAEQNTQMLELLKKGLLIDPENVILSGWYTLTGGKRYYYDETGAKQYGWLTVNGKTYYLDPSTGVMTTGSLKIDGVTYDFGTDGVLVVTNCGHADHDKTGTCLSCGESVGHNYQAIVTAPTCASEGYTTYTCACGDSYLGNFVSALGHSYQATVTAPTCANEGYTTYVCPCGSSYLGNFVPALGHTYQATVTAPTCVNEGYTTYVCPCGDSYLGNFISALGHTYSEGVCITCGKTDPDHGTLATITLKSATLSFEDEILYNLYFITENMDVAPDQMGLIVWEQEPSNATILGGGTILPGAVYDSTTGRYMVSSMGVPGQYLGDTKYLMVYARQSDGSYVYSNVLPYSAKQYCINRLEKSQSETTKALCVALMNYGAEAQKYFGYKTNDLMNAQFTAYQNLVETYRDDMMAPRDTVTTAKAGSFGVSSNGFTSRTATMSADGNFSLNYYFTVTYPTDHVTFYCWTAKDYANAVILSAENATFVKEMAATDSPNQFWADVREIAAKDIDKNVYVCGVYQVDGVTYSTGVIPYSIGYYCTRKAAASGEMQDLAKAMAVYCYYAKAYFGIS